MTSSNEMGDQSSAVGPVRKLVGGAVFLLADIVVFSMGWFRIKGMRVSRADDPFFFWLMMAFVASIGFYWVSKGARELLEQRSGQLDEEHSLATEGPTSELASSAQDTRPLEWISGSRRGDLTSEAQRISEVPVGEGAAKKLFGLCAIYIFLMTILLVLGWVLEDPFFRSKSGIYLAGASLVAALPPLALAFVLQKLTTQLWLNATRGYIVIRVALGRWCLRERCLLLAKGCKVEVRSASRRGLGGLVSARNSALFLLSSGDTAVEVLVLQNSKRAEEIAQTLRQELEAWT